MNTLRKVLMLVLAMVLVLGLVACGPKKNEDANPAPAPQSSPSGEEAQQIVTAAPGKITILTDMELTLGFDNNGNALALTGNSDVASRLAAQCNIAGKSCADAMAIILPLLTEVVASPRKEVFIVRLTRSLMAYIASPSFSRFVAISRSKSICV